jgi:hypothetical protein
MTCRLALRNTSITTTMSVSINENERPEPYAIQGKGNPTTVQIMGISSQFLQGVVVL